MRCAKLILYVVDQSASCERAIDCVHRALRRFPRRSIEFIVRNLSGVHESDRTAGDRAILIAPTLSMLHPHPRYLVGHGCLDVSRIVEFVRHGGLGPRGGDEEGA